MKDKVNFKIYDVTTWLSNNCNAHIGQYLTIKGNQTMKFGQLKTKQDKNLNILRTKRAFKIEQKTFFIVFKGLSLTQIKNFFGRREPDFKDHLDFE